MRPICEDEAADSRAAALPDGSDIEWRKCDVCESVFPKEDMAAHIAGCWVCQHCHDDYPEMFSGLEHLDGVLKRWDGD